MTCKETKSYRSDPRMREPNSTNRCLRVRNANVKECLAYGNVLRTSAPNTKEDPEQATTGHKAEKLVDQSSCRIRAWWKRKNVARKASALNKQCTKSRCDQLDVKKIAEKALGTASKRAR